MISLFFKFRAKKFSSIVHLVLPRGFVKVQVTKWEFLVLEGLTVKQIRKDSGKVPGKQDEHELRKQIEFRSWKTRGKSQKNSMKVNCAANDKESCKHDRSFFLFLVCMSKAINFGA